MACNAESISSSSVMGRFSVRAIEIELIGCCFGFGLPRSEVIFPAPFFRGTDFEVILSTLEGEGVRDISEDDTPRETDGDIRTVCGLVGIG